MDELYKLKKMLCDELEEYGRKGDMTTGSLDIVDKLAHAIKNLDKIIEAYDESEGRSYDGGSYDGGSYRNSYRRSYNSYRNSYARKRDSRGRYSRDYSRDYSRNADAIEQLRDMMDEMPDQHMRSELQKIVAKMENM